MSDLYTNSRIACHRACPRRHEIRYEHGLVPEAPQDRQAIGSAYHLAHWQGEQALDRVTMDPFCREAARAMYRAWTPRMVAEYVGLEVHCDVSLGASRTARDHRYAGAIDAIVRLADGRLAVLERKTTSGLSDHYWRRVELDAQVTGYYVLARAAGWDVQTVVYDVAERPGCRRLLATPEALRRYRKTDGALYENQRARDETPAEHFERCLAAMTSEKYDMREVPMTAQRIEEWERDAAESICAIESGFRYRNTDACAPIAGAPCDYLAVCHRTDLGENTPVGYVRLSDVHPELAARGASPAHCSPGASPAGSDHVVRTGGSEAASPAPAPASAGGAR